MGCGRDWSRRRGAEDIEVTEGLDRRGERRKDEDPEGGNVKMETRRAG